MFSLKFIKQLFSNFGRDKLSQQSAAFAYIAVFSLGPLLLVIISVSGFIFGAKAASGELFNQLSSNLGSQTAKTLQSVIANTHKSSNGVLALVIGSVGLLLGATGITSQLQNTFNIIFKAVPDPKGGIKQTIYTKFKNILIVLVGALAVVASVAASAVIVGLAKQASSHTGTPTWLLEIVDNVISLLVFVFILYSIYKTLPSVRLPNKIAWTAAFWTSILFLVGKIILGIIIGRNGTASAYGAAASLVTLLLWIYYSSQILFLGAEGIQAYVTDHSITLNPKKSTLKRQTFVMDSKGYRGRLLEAFVRGTKKRK